MSHSFPVVTVITDVQICITDLPIFDLLLVHVLNTDRPMHQLTLSIPAAAECAYHQYASYHPIEQ